MPKPRVKTSVKQRPRGSEFQRCGACGHGVGADDKFCTGCGKPLTGAAPAVAPQKQRQRPKTKTKPAAPRMKKRKPITVPPRMKKRKPITVPAAAPQVQKRVPITVSNMYQLERYLNNEPRGLLCGRCMKKVSHTVLKCPACGVRWELCQHEDGKTYRAEECVAYHTWAAWAKSQAGN